MNTASSERSGEQAAPSRAAVARRVVGAAVTGALLSYLSFALVDWANRYDDRTCAKASDFCMTLAPLLSIPASLAIALVVLIVAYRLLGIRPRLAVVPPTLLLAPFVLVAARTTIGPWPAVLAGAVWAAALVLTLWRPYRALGLSLAGVLLLASLGAVYR
ncbi:hypothetical protein [Streptomyces sp. NPDC018610]|uniref:hypothetical protein n=1 Tax=Streptomyces sp. NPDC018610 TaxID=3365049 RepID=UPI00378FBA4A